MRTTHAPRTPLGRCLGARALARLLSGVLAIGVFAPGAAASGLLVPNDRSLPPLRITTHDVSAHVRDGLAVTRIKQVFHNDRNRRLEATYVFPLAEGADLTGFELSFNGKMVEGEVLPAQEAAAIYESIVRQTRDPGLIEFIGRRLLRMRVFPIEPNSDTTIVLQYQQVCRPMSGMSLYHYPMRTNQTNGTADGLVRLAIDLETAHPLKAIWSPTHAVEIVRAKDEHSAKIAYEATGGSLEDDFMLLYDTDGADVGLSCVAYRADDDAPGHFVLMLTPKQLWPDDAYEPQDVVFVVDTSGSMAGEKLEQAKAALKYSIDRLDARDRFTVVRFSTACDVFSELRSASAGRDEVKTWIDGFDARGGTNITDTLKQVMAMVKTGDGVAGRPFVVVFLTDGRGNRTPDEILGTVTGDMDPAAAERVRIFPFGVGHDVNTDLLDQLPERFTGRPTYVQPGENLEIVLGDFFAVISRPVLTNLQLTLPDIGVTDRFPVDLGDLYHGQQLTAAARFEREGTGPVKLTATRAGQRVEYVWPEVAFRSAEGADAVPSVWAGRKIAYLVDQIRRHGETQEMVDEVLTLSMQYKIQTPYSSWLVAPDGAAIRRARGAPGSDSWHIVTTDGVRSAPMSGAGGGRGGGFGGGGGAGGGSTGRRSGPGLFRLPATSAPEADVNGGEQLRDDLITLLAGVEAESGEAAVMLSKRNAEMRELRSRDESRLSQSALVYREIDRVGYFRYGGFLVDDRVTEDTELVVIAFASDAWFEFMRKRPDLRAALAASRDIVLVAQDGVALVVSTTTGAEAFTDEMREQLGL